MLPVSSATMFADVANEHLRAGRSRFRVGTRLIALGLLILLVQGILWFEQGYWTPFDLQGIVRWLGVRIPWIGWQGAQAVVDWVLAFPLTALPIAIGFSLAWSGAARAGRVDKNSEYWSRSS
jgi:hypothetical protein